MTFRNSDEPAVNGVSSQTGGDPEAPDLRSVECPPASQVQTPKPNPHPHPSTSLTSSITPTYSSLKKSP